jgi:hypothetical protein
MESSTKPGPVTSATPGKFRLRAPPRVHSAAWRRGWLGSDPAPPMVYDEHMPWLPRYCVSAVPALEGLGVKLGHT